MTWRLAGIAALAVLAGCQSERPGGALHATVDNSAAVAVLQRVNAQAQQCWVGSAERDFAVYRVIPELDTHAGKPRILIVSAKAAQGLPQLVIEGSGNPVKLATYGPLTAQPLSARINADITRWATGGSGCEA
ncbi:MAG: hypothetical protein K8H74_13390 [Notoacmeibacter sp.]|nr:hypothetical protein [Notoacmeibacter sp.]